MRGLRPAAAVALLGVAAWAAPAIAGDDLRAAFDAMKAGQEKVAAANEAKDAAGLKAAQAALPALHARFRELFAGADWNAIDPVKDRDMLGSGLLSSGKDALRRGDAKAAIRAFETILGRLPKEPFALPVSLRLLPSACLEAGQFERAIGLWETWAGSPDAASAGCALVSLGDLSCARGDLAAARASWAKAAALPVKDEKDPAGAPVRDAAARLSLVGKRAPEIDSGDWMGVAAAPLSSLAGKVVVVDFWASWSAPCRASMPALQRLFLERRGDGLLVIGVTRYYPEGFLPPKGTKDPEGEGERVMKIAEDDYRGHVEAFRANMGIDYPFVMTDSDEYEAYRVVALPTTVVLDRKGNVALLKSGSADGALLRIAVDRLLAEGK